MEATTVICVRHKGKVSIGGDGQVTMHATVVKHTAKKVRKLFKDRCLAGFAGAIWAIPRARLPRQGSRTSR